ncbi:MAG: hypothetical protein QGG73_05675, partial [Candidatus Hydrogenedentes bacterium]|nr:hypothetical protein [Candidatus Hydrogenedentota bacterium]
MRLFLQDYGMVVVLLALCCFFSVATLKKQPSEGPVAAKHVVELIRQATDQTDMILVVSSQEASSKSTAESITDKLGEVSYTDVLKASGSP